MNCDCCNQEVEELYTYKVYEHDSNRQWLCITCYEDETND